MEMSDRPTFCAICTKLQKIRERSKSATSRFLIRATGTRIMRFCGIQNLAEKEKRKKKEPEGAFLDTYALCRMAQLFKPLSRYTVRSRGTPNKNENMTHETPKDYWPLRFCGERSAGNDIFDSGIGKQVIVNHRAYLQHLQAVTNARSVVTDRSPGCTRNARAWRTLTILQLFVSITF